MEGDRFRFVVEEREAGERLDKFLASRMRISRKKIMSGMAEGQVLVDGRVGRKGDLLSPGQEVLARLHTDMTPVPQGELDLTIHYEDASLLVVEKPSGWPTHPLRQGERGTLANAVVARAPSCASAGRDPREGGAAHRLDTQTSGLVAFAKDRSSWEALREQFSSRTVTKEYLALVEGNLEGSMVIEDPIARTPGTPGKMRVAPGGREAQTFVEPWPLPEGLQPPRGWSFVRCKITTGVMHQIRVHLSSIGHPIAGDRLYGGAAPKGLGRLFLHAATLGFAHPRTGEALLVHSSLPEDLRSVLRISIR